MLSAADTTANAVASYLGVKVHTLPGSGTEEVPPMSEIHGVDLTTEASLRSM